MTQRE